MCCVQCLEFFQFHWLKPNSIKQIAELLLNKLLCHLSLCGLHLHPCFKNGGLVNIEAYRYSRYVPTLACGTGKIASIWIPTSHDGLYIIHSDSVTPFPHRVCHRSELFAKNEYNYLYSTHLVTLYLWQRDSLHRQHFQLSAPHGLSKILAEILWTPPTDASATVTTLFSFNFPKKTLLQTRCSLPPITFYVLEHIPLHFLRTWPRN